MFSIRNDPPPALRGAWLAWLAAGALLVGVSVWGLADSAAGLAERGMHARVFGGAEFAGEPAVIAQDRALDPARSAQLSGLDPQQPFSIEWEGVAMATEDGIHHLRVRVDDGAAVWVDDRLLLEHFAAGRHDLSAPVHLARGPHRLRIRYAQLGGDTWFRLSWARPSWREHFVAVPVTPSAEARTLGRVNVRMGVPAMLGLAWSCWLIGGLALAFLTSGARVIFSSVAASARSGLAMAVLAIVVLGYGVQIGAAPWRGWAADEVLPAEFLPAAQEWFVNGWSAYYPPLHLYLVGFVVSPFLWLAQGGWVDLAEYDTQYVVHVVGRALSVVMGAMTLVVMTVLAGVTIGKQHAMAAAFFLLSAPPFVYYSKTMNLDIPYVFWLSIALLMFVRALTTRALSDHISLGAAVALAVATKDQAYGFFPVAALVLLWAAWRDRRELPSWPTRVVATAGDCRLWAGAATCLVVYALTMGVLWNLDGVVEHFALITGGASQHFRMFAPTPRGMGELAMATLALLPSVLGPVGAALAALGLGFALWQPRRHRLVLLLTLVAIGYLATFVAVVGYIYDRFLLGVALPAALLSAIGFDRVIAAIPNARVRTAIAAGLLALALWPAIDVNRRLAVDSRREVEAWLAPRLPADPFVVGSGLRVYLPNLHPFRHVVETRPGVGALLEWNADLIVLNEEWVNRSRETLAGASATLETAGYQRVFSAGREATAEPFSNVKKLSPPLSVWQRNP